MIAIALLILILQKKSIASKTYYMSGLRRPRLIRLKALPRVLCYAFIIIVLFVSMLPLGTILFVATVLSLVLFRKLSGDRSISEF